MLFLNFENNLNALQKKDNYERCAVFSELPRNYLDIC